MFIKYQDFKYSDRHYLVDVEDIFIEENSGNYYIVGNQIRYLGKYDTETRALEIFDEIKNFIINQESSQISCHTTAQPNVYEMPTI